MPESGKAKCATCRCASGLLLVGYATESAQFSLQCGLVLYSGAGHGARLRVRSAGGAEVAASARVQGPSRRWQTIAHGC